LHKIEYGTKNIEFEIERKATLKNTYISVSNDGVLVKTDNKTSIEQIKQMVEKKSSWIDKKLRLFKTTLNSNNIKTGSRLYYMGKSYYTKVLIENSIKSIKIEFTHSKFQITAPSKYTNAQLNSAIENFYRERAIKKITPLSKKWAKVMEVEPENISFRYSKTRWGSCSSTNRISFNYHLIKLPSSLIEYVVIHELAHITYKNHSKKFWELIYKYLNDYKEREDRIKTFENIL